MKDMFDQDFSNLAAIFQESLDWVGSMGVRTTNTRFEKYLKRIRTLEVHSRNGSLTQLNSSSSLYFDALYEFSDLSYAYQIFRGHEPAGLADLLGKLVKGPESTRTENEKNSTARNFSFETLFGARLAGSDIDISFTKSGDVYAGPLPFPVYVQCKRPRTLNSLGKRMIEASKQLKHDLDNDPNEKAIGIIAIDATHLINPDLILLHSPTRELSDSWHMRMLSNFCAEYVETNMREDNLTRHVGIVEVIVRFSGQWAIQATGTIHYHHDLLSMHFPHLNLAKLNQAYYFEAMMQRQSRRIFNTLQNTTS